MWPIPAPNCLIAKLVYNIETALRELIVELMEANDGTTWYKRRLPSDVLDKYKGAMQVERSTKWTRLVPHHPIYYIDFADLRKIFEKADNWKDVFSPVFVRRDLVASALSELEFIRNKVAHNRKATDQDVEVVRANYSKLSEWIGEERFSKLAGRNTLALNIGEQLRALRDELATAYTACRELHLAPNLLRWHEVRRSWWFDDSYLGYPVLSIREFFELVEEYAALPRARGTGHMIEQWVGQKPWDALYADAQSALSAALQEWSILG